MYISVIAERLKRFRQEAGLSQEELAERSGIDQSNISRIETASIGTVEIDTLVPIAAALGITTADLTGERDPLADPKIREVGRVMQTMPEYKKDAVVGAATALAQPDEKAS